MKIAFFLTPKADVATILSTATARQAIERMAHHKFAAIPVISPDGRYENALTEGDILAFWSQHSHLQLADLEKVPLASIARRLTVRPIDIDAEMELLLSLVIDQSFVPVVDGRGAFIGIVRRRAILHFFRDRMLGVLRSAVA